MEDIALYFEKDVFPCKKKDLAFLKMKSAVLYC